VPDPGAVEGAYRAVDASLPLVNGVIRSGRASAPAGLMDGGRECGRRIEDGIAGGRSEHHRCFHVTKREVCAPQVTADPGEHRGEVIAPPAAQDEGSLPNGAVNEQIAARGHNQPDLAALAGAGPWRGCSPDVTRPGAVTGRPPGRACSCC